MTEEKIIDENELDDLLEEAKGEGVVETKVEPVVEIEKKEAKGEGVEETEVEPIVETGKEEAKEREVEIELEAEKQEKVEVETKKEGEGVELEVEEEKVEQKEVIVPEVVPVHNPEQPQQSLAIQPLIAQTGLVAPVCSVQEAVRIFKEFEQAKKEILTSKDIIWFGDDGRPCEEGQGSPHIKRPGWRKLARFFGLSWDIISVSSAIPMQNGGYMYKTKVRIWHPAGASIIAEGITTSKDSFLSKGGRKEANEEDVIMKSETVAINRGINDILGGGEVSAEELD